MRKHQVVDGKIVIGLTEKVVLRGSETSKAVMGKVDTGATKSSIDERLAKRLKLGPVIRSKLVKSAHGNRLRPMVNVTIELAGKTLTEEFTIADRKHLKYQVLIGQNVLKDGFLIDPTQ